MGSAARASAAAARLRQRARAALAAFRNPPLYPDGHFYAPTLSADDLRREQEHRRDGVPWVDLDTQLSFVKRWAEAVAAAPHPTSRGRYRAPNGWFDLSDALLAHAVLVDAEPRRIIEIGSGWSSAALVESADSLGLTPLFTFVEPYPDRLLEVFNGKLPGPVVRRPVQEIDLEMLEELESGDVLFIDSSHVVKAGSDVVHLVNRVLPRLRDGVRVHFHDIFFPFTYPDSWLRQGRIWTESYIVEAFLRENRRWRVLAFNSMLARCAATEVTRSWPNWSAESDPGSLWLVAGSAD